MKRLFLKKVKTDSFNNSSGRKGFDPFSRIHNFYLEKFKFYRSWHSQPNSKKIHQVTLSIFALFALLSALYIMPFSPFRAKAASNYYVDASSSCSSGCGSISSPHKTIQAAISAAAAGDYIYVKTGTYNERVTVSKTVTVKGTSNLSDPNNSGDTGRPIIARGIHFTAASATVKQVEITPGGQSADYTAEGSPSGWASALWTYTDTTLEDVYVHDLTYTWTSGNMYVADGGSGVKIKNSTFSNVHVTDNKWRLFDTGGNWIVEGNTFQEPDQSHARRCSKLFGVHSGDSFIGNYFRGPQCGNTLHAGGPSGAVNDVTIKGNTFYQGGRYSGVSSDEHVGHLQTYGTINNWVIEGNIFTSVGTLEQVDTNGNGEFTVNYGGGNVDTWDPGFACIALQEAGQAHVEWNNLSVRNNIILGGGRGDDPSSFMSAWFMQPWNNNTGFRLNGLNLYNNTFLGLNHVTNSYKLKALDFHFYNGANVTNSVVGVKNYNNIYVKAQSPGNSSPYINSDYNLYDSGYHSTIPSGESHSKLGAPLFVNQSVTLANRYGIDADFRSQSSSSAINAGISDTNTPTTDKDGNPRVGAPDIGAYEYQIDPNGIYVSKTGNDTTGDGTELKPYFTITKAISVVSAGKTIYIKSGTYNEAITVSASGNSTNLITLDNYGTDSVRLNGGLRLSGSYITVKDIEVSNGNIPSGNSYFIDFLGSHNTFDNLNIHDIPSSIFFSQAGQYNTVQNSSLIRGGNDSLNIEADNTTIKNNTINQAGFTGNWSTDLRIPVTIGRNAGTISGVLIEGNELEGPFPGGANGIHIPVDAQNITIRNNKVYKIAFPSNTGIDFHTQTIGFYATSTNITIEGNVLGSEEVPSGYTLGFTHIYAGESGKQLTNFVVRNNVILSTGGDYWFHTDPRVTSQNGLYVYNNVIKGGGFRDWDTGATNFFCKNNILIGGAEVSGSMDYNMYVGSEPITGEGGHSFRTDLLLSQIFMNPDFGSATKYGVNANLNLKSGSPAINAGILDGNTPTTDAAGNPRVGAPDIGAYEYGSSGGTCTIGNGDVNGDTHVNISDAAILMAKWNQNVTSDPADVNCSGKVDISDAAILMSRWGT